MWALFDWFNDRTSIPKDIGMSRRVALSSDRPMRGGCKQIGWWMRKRTNRTSGDMTLAKDAARRMGNDAVRLTAGRLSIQ